MNIRNAYFKFMASLVAVMGVVYLGASFFLMLFAFEGERVNGISLIGGTLSVFLGIYFFIVSLYVFINCYQKVLNHLNIAFTIALIGLLIMILERIFSAETREGELYCNLVSIVISYGVYKYHSRLLKRENI